MNRKVVMGLAVVIVAAVVIISSYVVMNNGKANSDGSDDDVEEVQITDMLGRTVNVTAGSYERIVCVGASALRWIVYMNATDQVVGVEEVEKNLEDYTGRTYFAANTQLADLPSIGPQFGGDPELISAVLPDIVFVAGLTVDQCNSYQGTLGVPVVGLTSSGDITTHWDIFCQQMRLIGKVLDKNERAEGVINFIEGTIDDIQDRVANHTSDGAGITAYVGGLSSGGYHGFDYTSGNYAPFVLTDISNVITSDMLSGKTVGQIDIEKVVALDPDVVFIDYGGYSLCKEDYAKFSASLDQINAFENGSLYSVLPYNWYATNWDTVLVDCYYVASVMHPSAFTDVNISDKANEIWTYLVGSPIYDEMVDYYGPLAHVTLA
jgi:iron complex transport system substrate-binding protein